jgi:ribose 1,5-bisphosphokinase
MAALLPVCLQVSPDILRSRLQSRGRENAREIDQRLERAARYTPSQCHILNNDGSLLQSVDNFSHLSVKRRNNMPDCQLRPATPDDAPPSTA